MSSQNTTSRNPSPFRDGVDKLTAARLLYMAGDTTQKSIAKQVDVSERTVYTWIKENHWDKLRQAARSAPAVIANNMFSQLVELQNDIASREVGKRYPTMQEAELTRKLCLSIDRMKSAPGLSQSMQVLQLFRSFAQSHYDNKFHLQLNQVIELFLEGNAKSGFMPYEMEYGADIDTVSALPETPEKTENFSLHTPVPAHTGQSVDSTSPHSEAGADLVEPDPEGKLLAESRSETQPEVVPSKSSETLISTASQPISGTPAQPAETGSKTEVSPHSLPPSLTNAFNKTDTTRRRA